MISLHCGMRLQSVSGDIVMTYKTVLVHLDAPERSRARLDVAISLAKAENAHLTGLHVAETLDAVAFALAAPYGGAAIPPELIERDEEAAREAAARAETFFNEAIGKAGIAGEWRTAKGAVADQVAMHARYADVVVLGQGVGGDPETSSGDRFLPEDVVLIAGRPVLVVPDAWAAGAAGKTVLVAWNASREATRAVTDALPILARAGSVTVLAVNPEGGPEGHGAIACADIALYLARHGVKAEAAETQAKNEAAGEVILARAKEIGADLVVAGGYGHSRLREYVLGGVTHDLLRKSPVPVLLSH